MQVKKKNEKWDKIEELFEADCKNGKHAQKKIKSILKKKGICPQTVLKELELLKDS